MPHLKAWYTIEIRLRNTFSVPFLRIFPDSKLENSLCETERERETVCRQHNMASKKQEEGFDDDHDTWPKESEKRKETPTFSSGKKL